ncbi:hypothetical protein C6Q17_26195 [Burkholderia contaminans]|nr:hypothetical protein C6Q17_26195 [Burkholderia contaminans]
MPSPRHLVDVVLIVLPLECGVPRQELCRRQRNDLVEVGYLRVAAVIGSKKFSNDVVSVNTFTICVNLKIAYRVVPTVCIKRAPK